MANNYYDDRTIFDRYGEMQRSQKGLEAAGEWEAFKKMIPDLKGAHVLDLGCGYGWHCEYAVAEGAEHVVGVDISEKMIERAKQQPNADKITYIQGSLDDLEGLNFETHEFDVVMSSLALHYLPSFSEVVEEVKQVLTINGTFVFSVEHPIFTAHGSQDWIYDDAGNKVSWPVDNYHREGERQTNFLGESVTKYHKTMAHYLSVLIEHNFVIKGIDEPIPSERLIDENPDMKDELRRPMMLIISARRK
ncbi:class I SAM-dependent methyltransferase [Macrococcus lamae]|uniref:Class I SAM-dependent methyltransferase n=2 Tax=Macrococcus lamae TaxID=198484 RepID=A0A4R6BUI3_9STAP|nr:class I SAM-dependent methyltransferase [Macrococcus lamae]TDM11962.1 class I SAM-dependent methyltransferase [Macrococcus lamae]